MNRQFARACSVVLSLFASSLAMAQGAGPDVIVGDVSAVASYGSENGISAFSVGTTSCNQGTAPLNWFAGTPDHPVISGSLYRWRSVNGAGQFEQIGISQLKHGYFALSGALCFNDCQGDPTGHTLGVHCSDPYGATTNGQQSNLGPRSDVNAFTGQFPYPFTNRPYSGTSARRLRVADTDLDPSLNPGAVYFFEGQYVAADDAAAQNANNNASYRRFTLGGVPTNYTFAPAAPTVRTRSAVFAWRELESDVTIAFMQVPGEGLFQLAYKVTPLDSGLYHYEYALHNLDSDRSASSFTIMYPPGAFWSCINFANTAFHDVAYDPTEPYDGTDWSFLRGPESAAWTIAAPFNQNPNGNALRWGTTYTFRFDSRRPPTQGTIVVGLFKPGTPDSISIAAAVPSACDCPNSDLNDDGVSDQGDILYLIDVVAGSPDPNQIDPDLNQDGCVDQGDVDFLINIIAGGPCGG